MTAVRTSITLTALVGNIAFSAIAHAQDVTRITVVPATVQITIGQTKQVVATAYGSNGSIVSSARLTWSSSNVGLARVSWDPNSSIIGNIEGLGVGLVNVEARVGNTVQSIPVQISAGGNRPRQPNNPPVTGAGATQILQLDPGQLLLLPGESALLTPAFLRSDGSPATPEPVTWASLGSTVASVNNGMVTGLSQGTAIVQGTTESDITGTATIQVQQTPIDFTQPAMALAPGLTDTVQVVVPTQNNRTIAPLLMRWSSTNPSVASVSRMGVVTAMGRGNAEIIVSGFLQEKRLPVAVHAEVRELTWLPSARSPVNIPIDGNVKFDVQALDASEAVVPEAVLVWEIGDSTIVRFDRATTTATGIQLGNTTVKAISPGRGSLEVEWDVRVIAGGIMLATHRAGLGIRDEVTVPAQFTDDAGTPFGEATGVEWSSSDEAVATVSRTGTITGTGIGRTSVIASTPWGRADTIEVFVQGELIVLSDRSGSLDAFSLNRNAPGNLNQVTADSGQVVSAKLSPDGTRLVYVSSVGQQYDVFLADADGSNSQQLTRTEANELTADWSADGSQIVYQSNGGGSQQIWVMESDGTGQRQLTQEGTNTEPAVSAEDKVLFTSTRDNNYEIYMMDLDGGNQRNVTTNPGRESHPQWMPDGRIAFIVQESSASGQTARVTVIDDMGARSTLSPREGAVIDFSVSPSGDLMAMIMTSLQSRRETNQLYLLPLSTGAQATKVTTGQADEHFYGVSFRR